MANTDLSKLFNPQAAVVESPQAVRNTDEYKVSFKDGKGGIYESIIRFVPWYADPDKSIIAKTVSYVKNPITQQGIYVDDPRTVGSFSPIIDMFSKFYNSGNAVFQDFGKKHLSSKTQYAALVQIIKDDQHPDLVGKIKVFKFGQKLYDKINAEMHPAMGQGVLPYHPIYGRYFYLKCTSQSGFNNFDQSYFFDNKNAQNQILPMGVWYMNPATGKMDICTEQTDQQVFADYLAANSPDLSRYEYNPWTSEQERHINDALKIMADYKVEVDLSDMFDDMTINEQKNFLIDKFCSLPIEHQVKVVGEMLENLNGDQTAKVIEDAFDNLHEQGQEHVINYVNG